MMSKAHRAKVTQLKTPYSQSLADQKSYVRHVHVRRARLIIGVFLVVMVVLTCQLIGAHRSLAKINQNIQTTRVAVKNQRSKNARLEKQLKLLHDPAYTQQIMREKYNYAKKGETIYNFSN